MTIVRIVFSPGWLPEGSVVTGRDLIVLADDTEHRAVPLWLRVPKQLWRLLDAVSAPGTGEDAVMTGVLEQTAARLLHMAGVRVTAVDIEPAGEGVQELRSDTIAARVALATVAGTRHAQVSAVYGLALAAAAGSQVRVADEVMDRLAVPVQGGDVRAPFLPPAAAQPRRHPGLRRRPEPRNMTFADGLDYWELAGDFPGDGQPHWQDYSCSAAGQSAVLAAAVPQPAGFAVLVQTIDADHYRGRTVTFRGQLRSTDVGGRAGLHLAAGAAYEPPGTHLCDHGGGGSLTATGTWTGCATPTGSPAGWAASWPTSAAPSGAAHRLPCSATGQRTCTRHRRTASRRLRTWTVPTCSAARSTACLPGSGRPSLPSTTQISPPARSAVLPAPPRPACTRHAAGSASTSPRTVLTSSPPPGESS